jgi:L-fuconolactonase
MWKLAGVDTNVDAARKSACATKILAAAEETDLRIDSHVLYSQAHPPEHLQAILARNRFDGAILVGQFSDLPADCPQIAGLVVPIGRLAEYLGHPKIRGVCCSLADGIPAGLDELTGRGIPLDLEVQPGQLSLVLRIAEQAPTLRIAIDHLGRPPFDAGPTTEWVRGMEAAARLPNVFCKVSGLLTGQRTPWAAAPLRPFVHHVFSVFGPGRLMFGSEWPACLPAATWKETLAAFTQSIGARSVEVREQLLGGTATRFYGLD